MKKKLLSLTLALAAMTMQAQDEYSTLVVETMKGTKLEISLQKAPKVQMTDNAFIITCGEEITGYTYGEVRKYYFKLSKYVSVEPVADERTIRVAFVDNATVVISGVDNPEVIRLYTLDGSRVAPQVEVAEGVITVSLSALDAGFYILNIDNEQSFKLLKR